MIDEKEISEFYDKAIEYKCEECGSHYFKELLRMKVIKKEITGDDKDVVLPYPVVVCSNCGNEISVV